MMFSVCLSGCKHVEIKNQIQLYILKRTRKTLVARGMGMMRRRRGRGVGNKVKSLTRQVARITELYYEFYLYVLLRGDLPLRTKHIQTNNLICWA